MLELRDYRSPMMCSVCGEVLFIYAIDDVSEWHHQDVSIDTDHGPQPVPADGSARLVCDFCSVPQPVWLLTTDEDPWCACPDCVTLVRRGDRAGLVDHAVEGLTKRSVTFASLDRHQAQSAVRTAHDDYWDHAQGMGVPIPALPVIESVDPTMGVREVS